jgi:ribosome maturation factor RimP
MNSFKENIVVIANEIVTASGFLLIDVVARGTERERVIEIYIDAEKNVTADDCAEISSKMIRAFEERELLKSPYRLDVSSPGVERPLIHLKQFPKHINRKFEITYNSDSEKKRIVGRLKEIDGEYLIFFSNKEIKINFPDVVKAKVLVDFS